MHIRCQAEEKPRCPNLQGKASHARSQPCWRIFDDNHNKQCALKLNAKHTGSHCRMRKLQELSDSMLFLEKTMTTMPPRSHGISRDSQLEPALGDSSTKHGSGQADASVDEIYLSHMAHTYHVSVWSFHIFANSEYGKSGHLFFQHLTDIMTWMCFKRSAS